MSRPTGGTPAWSGDRTAARTFRGVHLPAAADVLLLALPAQPTARPGPFTDASDDRLAEFRRRVVEPVVTGMLHPHEIVALNLAWGVDGRDGDVWVCLDAPGDRYQDRLPSPWWPADPDEVDPPTSEAEIAEHLADRLQDWIAESSFAWGELRHPGHVPPG